MEGAPQRLRDGLTALLRAQRPHESRKPTLADLAGEHPPGRQYIAYLVESGAVCAIARALVHGGPPARAEVNLVHVAEAHRGRGLCGRVVRALLAGTPAASFELHVDKTNAAARACYRGAGFVETQTSGCYITAVRM